MFVSVCLWVMEVGWWGRWDWTSDVTFILRSFANLMLMLFTRNAITQGCLCQSNALRQTLVGTGGARARQTAEWERTVMHHEWLNNLKIQSGKRRVYLLIGNNNKTMSSLPPVVAIKKVDPTFHSLYLQVVYWTSVKHAYRPCDVPDRLLQLAWLIVAMLCMCLYFVL